eukprot:546646-Pleurochrysis_carterae.AAC.1
MAGQCLSAVYVGEGVFAGTGARLGGSEGVASQSTGLAHRILNPVSRSMHSAQRSRATHYTQAETMTAEEHFSAQMSSPV